MKMILTSGCWLLVLCFGMHAQVTNNPNTINGTVRFNNSNPAILGLLDAPVNEGLEYLYITASSVAPAPLRSSATIINPPDGRLSSSYAITVDTDPGGTRYSVNPRASLIGNAETYYFNPQISAPVFPVGAPPALDFAECLGVVTVRFRTPGGAAAAIDSGSISAMAPGSSTVLAARHSIPTGSTEARIYLRGGDTFQLHITATHGTDSYSDRLSYFWDTNVTALCDGFITLDVTLPSLGSLGQITGKADIIGEFEAVVDANDFFDYPDNTAVVANDGPFRNKRYAALPGVNFSTPSSGSYVLSNLVASTLDPTSTGYRVNAEFIIRSNRLVQSVRTPALGWGSNTAVAVGAGATVDLGNTFVIDPAFMRGNVRLQGPSESLGRLSLFRGVQHSGSHGDINGDGLPDGVGTYGVYWTTVGAEGVNRRAAGASLTAAFGYSSTDYEAAFNPASSAYEGNYDLVIGGLRGQRSIWRPALIALTMNSAPGASAPDYYFQVMTVSNLETNDYEVGPGSVVNRDWSVCFSEVNLTVRASRGSFYNPQVRFSEGTFDDPMSASSPNHYRARVDLAAGAPTSLATASNIGHVVLYLPQGTYRLYPSVTPADATSDVTGLEPFDITVGCGQRIGLEPCLQLVLNAPACTTTNETRITGAVRSCSNKVDRITYSLNGEAEETICNDCGPNPEFDFTLTLTDECSDNILIVTATGADGATSSITTTIRLDTEPPVIKCPAEIIVECSSPTGEVVRFTVEAADNCRDPVRLVCNPPSGSLFPVGITEVTCVATDACGNTDTCSFKVNVGGSALSIERAVIVRWTCGGILQGADNVSGPWTDISGATSPYCVPTSGARRFYRARN